MDNTPVFPLNELSRESGHIVDQHFGMTLRDYFAAKAMQGAFTSPIDCTNGGKEYIAMHAYKMADAMMAARGQQ